MVAPWHGCREPPGESWGLACCYGLVDRLGSDRRRRRGRIYRECRCTAGHAPCRVADHDNALLATIRGGCRGRDVTRRSCPADGGAVLLPLVAQWCGGRSHHGERGGLPCCYGLLDRRGSDSV